MMASKIKKDIRKAAAVNNANGAEMSNSFAMSIGVLAPTNSLNISPFVISDPSQGLNITDFSPQKIDSVNESIAAEMRARYDQAMSMNGADFLASGYFVTLDNGSIFSGTPDSGRAWLPIQDIQQIENERGTPGALLLHLKEPALAKATAGYEGGSSAATTTQPPPVTPIPEVQSLPPIRTVTGATPTTVTEPSVVFQNTGTPSPTTDGNTSIPVTSVPLPNAGVSLSSMTMPGGKYWWLWYGLAVLAIILYVKYGRK